MYVDTHRNVKFKQQVIAFHFSVILMFTTFLILNIIFVPSRFQIFYILTLFASKKHIKNVLRVENLGLIRLSARTESNISLERD